MAITITLDRLIEGRVVITKDPGDNAKISAQYIIATQAGQYPVTRDQAVPSGALTPTQQTQLNNLYAAVVNYIKSLEGLP